LFSFAFCLEWKTSTIKLEGLLSGPGLVFMHGPA